MAKLNRKRFCMFYNTLLAKHTGARLSMFEVKRHRRVFDFVMHSNNQTGP